MKNPTSGPLGRYEHGMAYDSESDRVVVFGGVTQAGLNGETWAYSLNSDSWLQKNPSTKPSPRAGVAIAYDSKSDRVIMFGGQTGSGPNDVSDETWAYNLNADQWVTRNPLTRPSPRRYAAMVYDSESDRIILFGGILSTGLGPISLETWAYSFESDQWTLMNPTTNPSAGYPPAMAYDSESDRAILFGGWTGSARSDETWAYNFNSNNWSKMDPSYKPSARSEAAMTYDSGSDRVIVFGGYTESSPTRNNETWLYDFNNDRWFLPDAGAGPSNRYSSSVAYVSNLASIVLYGGNGQTGVSGETWSLGVKTLLNPPSSGTSSPTVWQWWFWTIIALAGISAVLAATNPRFGPRKKPLGVEQKGIACSQCQAQLPPGSIFCGKCGSKLGGNLR